MRGQKIPSGGDELNVNTRHQARLMALLYDLIESEGPMKAAQVLGVNYKTVARSKESGRLSLYLKDALTRLALTRENLDAHPSEPGASILEARLEEVVQGLRQEFEDARAALEKDVNVRIEEHGRQLQDVLARLAQLDGHQAGERPEASMSECDARPLPGQSHRRLHIDLVTLEPEPGEEEAYGEATPLIVAWRQVRADFAHAGNRLARVKAEEKMRDLETAMLRDFRLTLPPAPQPWDDATRRDELTIREESLKRARRERIELQWRRRMRRVLTLGLWWN